MCVYLLVCRSVCLSTHQLSIIDLRAKPSFKCLKKLKGNNLLFFNSVFTKPKVLTRNKLYRAHSRYDEFFLRPWMRIACCILTSLHANVIGLSSVDPTKVRSSFCPESLLFPQTQSCPSGFAASNFPASHASPCLSTSYKARHSRPLEWTSLSHVLPMASYMWLPLQLAAHPNFAYLYPKIIQASLSTQKPCRTEERFIMLLDFYISLAMEGHLFIY